MTTVMIGIPFVQPSGNRQAAPRQARQFQASSGWGPGIQRPLAAVVRDHLILSSHPEGERYLTLPDERLVEQDDLILSVPDSTWEKHGYFPLGPWKTIRE